MADKFHVGQRVVWRVPDGVEYVATVTGRRAPYRYKGTGRLYLVYPLDLDGYGTKATDGCMYAAPEPELRPLYDGNQRVTWSECAWHPQKVR